jgi:hypothetical protein
MSSTQLLPIVGVFAAIVGAVVGAFANRLVNRPKPAAVVDQLAIESLGSKNPLGDEPIIKEKGLEAACAEAPFITTEFPTTQKTKESAYIDALDEVLEEISEMLDYRLPLSREVAGRLREYLNYEEYDEFEETWTKYQDTLWELLEMGHYRKMLRFNGSMPDYDNSTSQNTIRSDPSTGDFWVYTKNDSRPIGFPWSHRKRSKEDAKQFAKRAAHALAYRNTTDLRASVQFLNVCERLYGSLLESLKVQVQEELSRYRRLVLRGQVTNSGRSPYSVLNKGRMFIETKNIDYKKDGKEATYSDNMQVNILLTDSSELTDSPISIGSGEVRRFTAVSEDYVEELKDWEVLLDIFQRGAATFYIGMYTTLSSKSESTRYYTKTRDFRDWEAELNIPPR